MLPVVAFGTISEGSLTAELGVRYTGQDDKVIVIVMNMLVRSQFVAPLRAHCISMFHQAEIACDAAW